MPIKRMLVPLLAVMFSFPAIADEEANATNRAQPGLFDGMAEAVQRDLEEKHAARQENMP